MADDPRDPAGPRPGVPTVPEESAEDLYENAPCGYLSALPDGTIVRVNRTFLDWTGYRRDELVGLRRFQDLLTAGGRIFHETHYAPLLRMQGAVREIAVDIVCADERRLPALINSTLRFDEHGDPLLTRTTVFNATDRKAYERELLGARERERAARERTDRLQVLTAALAAGLLPEEIGEELVTALLGETGADRAGIWLGAGPGPLEAIVTRGLNDAIDPDAVPAGPVFHESLEPAKAPPPLPSDAGAAALLPLEVDERVIGMAALAFPAPHRFEEAERAYLAACAAQAAQALERARLQAETARSAERAAFMAETMHALIQVTTTTQRAERLAHAVVPRLAAAARVELVEVGDTPGVAATSGPGELVAKRSADIESRALASGNAQLAPDGRQLALPLRTSTITSGVMTLVRQSDAAPFHGRELEFLAEFADRGALALENARLFEYERDVAHTLQQSLLASPQARDARYGVATLYRTAVERLEVGGDWYDTFALDGDRVAVVVGDVVGRGIQAATAMGQLRSATRALALASAGPAEVLARLDAFAEQVQAAHVATLAYAEIDVTTGRIRYACAGHPPPLLLEPGAPEARVLWGGRSVPLSAGLGLASRGEAEDVLLPGARLLLYTDGLVERRDRPLDAGLDELAAVVARLGGEALPGAVAGISQALLEQDDGGDDVCVLLFGMTPAEPGHRPAGTGAGGAHRVRL